MSTIINDGISKPVFESIKAGWYSGKGETRFASVTQLLKPIKQTILTKRYNDKIVLNASDQIWSLMGSAMHSVLEKRLEGETNFVNEKRISVNILGKKITGGSDVITLDVHDLTDYKFTTVFTYLFLDEKKIFDWQMQLNMYKYLIEENLEEMGLPSDFRINSLNIALIFRDWRYVESLRGNSGYPRKTEEIPIQILPKEKVLKYMEERVSLLLKYENAKDSDLPICTKDETWEQPPIFAVMKKDRKNAVSIKARTHSKAVEIIEEIGQKIVDKLKRKPTSIDEYNALVKIKTKDYYIVKRESEPKMCTRYCPANKFCQQYIDRFGVKIGLGEPNESK